MIKPSALWSACPRAAPFRSRPGYASAKDLDGYPILSQAEQTLSPRTRQYLAGTNMNLITDKSYLISLGALTGIPSISLL